MKIDKTKITMHPLSEYLTDYISQLNTVNNIKTLLQIINNKKSQLQALDELVKSRFIEQGGSVNGIYFIRQYFNYYKW